MNSIEDLPNNGIKVLLLRRTGNDTVKSDVGYRDASGQIIGWFAKNPPTHWVKLPDFGNDNAAKTRKKLLGA